MVRQVVAGGGVTHDEQGALEQDILRLVGSRLLDPLEILLGDGASGALEELRAKARHDAATWAADLLGPDRPRAVHTGARLIAVLYPGDAAFDPPLEWWRTPLGRAIARRVGHPSAARVPYAVAGAMLGITRQGVHDLVRRGKLQQHPDGGVATRSVRERLDPGGAHGDHP
ncbi:hypothetical protein [Nonomuraea ferruginea]|uniref:MftR C-terminal domain-containing protein n=1 Tax=Nonomuraea ferruginea TaxID=46174 RepID=A0ABT4T122_9ACTN|nr:hypothetical protein [Nonomuraea ferruginea]MDA0643221.1 hypothetical protein [Nonomuraea ferruginea]